MATRPFVDFYRENRVSPVTQDISDRVRHFERRAALYRHLGVPPRLVRGASVIEFGPGSGFNSIFTSALSPRRYVLVDGNPTGLSACQALLAEQGAAETEHVFVESLIEDYATDERFDLVLCEGVIPMQLDPRGFLRRVAALTAPGGVLVITCMDSVSQFAELMRRIIGALLVEPEAPTAAKLATLRPLFDQHLNTLAGRSRLTDDWILDVIIQPWIGAMLSVGDAIEALDDGFDVHGASPHFLTDWRWYKDIHGDDPGHNRAGIDSYHRNLHNLLDYRSTHPPVDEDHNRAVLGVCDELLALEQRFQGARDRDALAAIHGKLTELVPMIAGHSADTAGAITDLAAAFDGQLASGRLGELGRFAALFGRGQQYLSFIRRGSPGD